MNLQSIDTVMVVEPTFFGYNKATAQSNVFQQRPELSNEQVRQNARHEFDELVNRIQSKGISVLQFPSTVETSTDAVFPNNWVSFHPEGRMVLYPMLAPNRRGEREEATIATLTQRLGITEVIDLTHYERENRFLEGTGSIVFDHLHLMAYACASPRTDIGLLNMLCERLEYKPMSFVATDLKGIPIYHTNVMMGVGTGYVIVCAESIDDLLIRKMLLNTLQKDREVIEISRQQMSNFCGNVLELSNGRERFLAMSQRAFEHFKPEQLAVISGYATPLPCSIPNIETIGGGSVRCMLAGIHT